MEAEIAKTQRQLQIQNYALSTQKTYLGFLKQFFYSSHYQPPVQREDILLFLQDLVKKNYATSSINQAVNAIKFYLEKVCHGEGKAIT